MKVPFSTEQFLSIFAEYNRSVFPAQILILLAGLFALYLILQKKSQPKKVVGLILSIFWLWAGIVYHTIFFTEINKAAYGFGALFIIQGILMFYETMFTDRFSFRYLKGIRGNTGVFLVLFGLILYPLISLLTKGLPELVISAGLPCPTVIATFGFLALSLKRIQWYLFIIPVIWSVVGISAAMNFGIYQDFMMILSAITVIVLNRKMYFSDSTSIIESSRVVTAEEHRSI